jgi:pyrimidine operon attenuation protein/uracil phosphoribosyltransferase
MKKCGYGTCMAAETSKTLLFDCARIEKAMRDVASAIIAEFAGPALGEVAIVGIQTRGVLFAERLIRMIGQETGVQMIAGTLDISMYRDDIGLRKSLPTIRETVIPFDMNGRDIILADDVLFTGRTIRAALDAVTDYGRPARIRLAALVDRSHREFPIRADYVGLTCHVPRGRKVKVHFTETDGEDVVYEIVPANSL